MKQNITIKIDTGFNIHLSGIFLELYSILTEDKAVLIFFKVYKRFTFLTYELEIRVTPKN